jgi:hypothetical protein
LKQFALKLRKLLARDSKPHQVIFHLLQELRKFSSYHFVRRFNLDIITLEQNTFSSVLSEKEKALLRKF